MPPFKKLSSSTLPKEQMSKAETYSLNRISKLPGKLALGKDGLKMITQHPKYKTLFKQGLER